jgi:hypothetical protein
MLLQTLDAGRNVRLHRMEGDCRLRHVALPRHFKENRKVNQKKSVHHTICFSDSWLLNKSFLVMLTSS